MTTLHIDFETYSAADLPACGLDNYATHSSTGVHCMAFCFDDEPVQLWFEALADNPWSIQEVSRHIKAGGTVVAHNAAFELAIWNSVCVSKYGWPPLRPEQMRCTMAQAYAMSLPGSLDKASAALGIEQRKDLAGARVMMQLAKPKLDGSFWKPSDDPAKFDKLYDYCKQDVEVERALDERMMQLSPQEQALWVLDYKINQRGVQVDLPSIEAAIRLVEAEKARLDKEMLRVTGGVVGKCTEVQLLVKWIRNEGVEIKGLAKADVLDGLAGDLPDRVRAALRLRQEGGKSSTAKLLAMSNRASKDGRVRGTLQYHGASTGRWAGRGIQVQNFPRPRVGTKPAHIEDIIDHIKDRDYIDINYGPVMDALADSLRAMIIAKPGHELIAMDFSAIEARVLAWLAGEEKVLDIFRTHGKIYEHAASGIYNKPIDQVSKDERQIGKVAVLALGYGGGVGAFQSMARVYGVKVADDKADEIKKAWRESHKRIVRYWYDLEGAAINAVELGVVCKAGPPERQIAFVKKGSFLWCKLPSGRVLCYPYPQIKQIDTPWGEQRSALVFMSVNGTTNKWEETKTYGGSLCENVTQAVARDLLAEALPRLEDNGFPVVFHAHDEVVVEIATSMGQDAEHQVEQLLSTTPAWAKGLPVTAEGWRAKRYRK
jgi:DNA polymerase